VTHLIEVAVAIVKAPFPAFLLVIIIGGLVWDANAERQSA